MRALNTEQVETVAALLKSHNWSLTTAESCTGGMVAAECTALPGSSNWFEGGFVTYSNDMKQKLLGVSPWTLKSHGAVSQAAAEQMAVGAARLAKVEVAIAVTGVAGPGGGSEAKPVGMVWFAWAVGKALYSGKEQFTGNRDEVRKKATRHAIDKLIKYLKSIS